MDYTDEMLLAEDEAESVRPLPMCAVSHWGLEGGGGGSGLDVRWTALCLRLCASSRDWDSEFQETVGPQGEATGKA